MVYHDRKRFPNATVLAALFGFFTGLAHADVRPGELVAPVTREGPSVSAHRTEAVAKAPGEAVEAARIAVAASEARLEGAELARARAVVRAQVEAGAFPGAVLVAGRGEKVALETGVGRLGWSVSSGKVDPARTVYDIASLTKVVGTTAAVMALYEDGKIDLDAPVSQYVPGFTGGAKGKVTIWHLLTHTAGLPAGVDVPADPAAALAKVIRTPLVRAPGEKVEYSDVGFIVLYEAARAAAGGDLYRYLDQRVYGPLKMRSTTYLPGDGCQICAPTGKKPDGSILRGVVHDPTARRLGGVTGNAGLFSTGRDVARFAMMMANEGTLDSVRVFKPETVRKFTRRQPGSGTRALGWDTPGPGGSGGAGAKLNKTAFGHTGFTGTSIWIDPERGTWTVLLANRTYAENQPNRMQSVRRSVNDRVATAADEFDEEAGAGLLAEE